ncbi:MAG: cobalamin biosynthesis protein [Lachnospiraceae bacterium]|nr:cobalamin biosynthesis protein [Lachnospiraceae bacterium]
MIKKCAAVAFSASGKKRIGDIERAFAAIKDKGGEEWTLTYVMKPNDLKGWCQEVFPENDAIIFVGALGIAVRTVAPLLVNKTIDPAVIVMDDMGLNVISVLSGHIGGANELTRLLAAEMGANPVITTASDVHGKIAVDSWAVRNNLYITDMECAKKVAMEIVEGRKVGLYCDCDILGQVPDELVLLEEASDFVKDIKWCIIISDRKISSLKEALREYNILWLIPKNNVVGVGCKKGKSERDINAAVIDTLSENSIDPRSVYAISSIDLKCGEPGLLGFSEYMNIPSFFYPGDELKKVPGEFDMSDFVFGVTGVDNVCERAAIRKIMEDDPEASRDRNLVVPKKKCEGVTVAVAGKRGCVSFE